MQVIIDRFEGNYAVVEIEKGKMANLPRELVPDAAEGDVVNISVDADAAAARKKRIRQLEDMLFK